jgi:hypothetical protein
MATVAPVVIWTATVVTGGAGTVGLPIRVVVTAPVAVAPAVAPNSDAFITALAAKSK